MQYRIFLFNPLISNVTRNTRLISKLTNCIDKISICPKLPSPKLGLHLWMSSKYLFGRDTLQHRNYPCGTHLRNRLNQKMNMILISPYFQKMNFIPLFNLQTNLFQRLINDLTEHNPTIFCRTHKMVQQYRYIVRLVYVFAFGHAYKDIVLCAAERRGTNPYCD